VDYKQAYYDLISADKIGMRERIAVGLAASRGAFSKQEADAMYSWIQNGADKKLANPTKAKGKRGRPKKVMTLELAAPTRSKKRRKYTKKSKFWTKKK